MEQLSLGVCGTSRKENEHRLPLHPRHLHRVPELLRPGIFGSGLDTLLARLRRVIDEHGAEDRYDRRELDDEPSVTGAVRRTLRNCHNR